MAQFYLTLPSNASMNVYPNNTLTTYKTLLPETVHLTEEHECAISEITLPGSWYNLEQDTMCLIKIDPSEDSMKSVRKVQKYLTRKMPHHAPSHSYGSAPVEAPVRSNLTTDLDEVKKVMVTMREVDVVNEDELIDSIAAGRPTRTEQPTTPPPPPEDTRTEEEKKLLSFLTDLTARRRATGNNRRSHSATPTARGGARGAHGGRARGRRATSSPPTASRLSTTRPAAAGRVAGTAHVPPLTAASLVTTDDNNEPPPKRSRRTVAQIKRNNQSITESTQVLEEELKKISEVDELMKKGYEGNRTYKILSVEAGVFNRNVLMINYLNKIISNQSPETMGALKTQERNPKARIFTYSEITRKISYILPDDHLLIIPEKLSYQLGMEGNRCLGNEGVAPQVMDIHHNAHTVYVYTDVIKHNIVGDAHAPLLRTVTIDWKDSEGSSMQQTISFSNLHYRPVRGSSFREITMYLRDATGYPVPFERGHVSVVLAFRPVLQNF